MDTLTAPEPTLNACPKCNEEFTPKRTNQQYCSSQCQKSASRNTARGPRDTEHQLANAYHYSRALDLADLLYSAPIGDRLGIMKAILEAAIEHDSGLRRILTDPKLLRANPTEKHLFHRRASGSFKTISQAANAYTQKFCGVSIQTYLRETRLGAAWDDYEVKRTVDHGPVPRLTKIRKAKCWHRPLKSEPMAEKPAWDEAEIERINAIVDAA